ncbi:hypothetical protein H0H92_009639 [Tricholoma furcatifolium]|nr:hypothetical protein H0H92_009639 [Tricholoma furcatifolium]
MTITLAPAASLHQDNVPCLTGRPTKEELLVYYPAQFTWIQLKTFINSGDLDLLKRHKKLQARFDEWVESIKAEYGSSSNYLLNYRLQWGKRDTLSLLTSRLDADEHLEAKLKVIPSLANVPPEVEHTLIWTRLPIFHEDVVGKEIAARVEHDGLWGFTGNSSPPPSPSTLPSCLPALAEWGVTMDKLVRSEPPTEYEAILIYRAAEEIREFVKNRWVESKWETAWCVNPPRLQSVPDLAHIHVFARPKLA